MSLITNSLPGSLRPDVILDAVEAAPEALINRLAVRGAIVEGDAVKLKVPYVDADIAAGFVVEGAAIGEQDPTLDEIEIATHKLGTITVLSNEAISAGNSLAHLQQSLLRSFVAKADAQFLNAATSPIGLTNIADIVDGGELGDDLDVLADAIATIESNGGMATHLLAHPRDWAHIAKLKAATGSNQTLLGTNVEQAQRRVLGLEVATSRFVNEGTLMVIDNQAIVSATGPIKITPSSEYAYNKDSHAVRVTWRMGWGTPRPERLVKIALDGS